jgi:hypothetical protein
VQKLQSPSKMSQGTSRSILGTSFALRWVSKPTFT